MALDIERTANPTIANRSSLLAPGWFLIIWVRRDIPVQQQNVAYCVRQMERIRHIRLFRELVELKRQAGQHVLLPLATRSCAHPRGL